MLPVIPVGLEEEAGCAFDIVGVKDGESSEVLEAMSGIDELGEDGSASVFSTLAVEDREVDDRESTTGKADDKLLVDWLEAEPAIDDVEDCLSSKDVEDAVPDFTANALVDDGRVLDITADMKKKVYLIQGSMAAKAFHQGFVA